MNGAAEDKRWYALTASQVMIMQTNIETIDAVGRKQIKTTGQNQAILLQDGVFKYIGWEKVSRSAPLSFRMFQNGERWSRRAGSTSSRCRLG